MATTRRKFLQQVAAWSAGLTVATPVFRLAASAAQAAEGPAGKVTGATLVVGTDKDYAALMGKVLAPLGGMAAFVHQGDRVVVKPNIGWDRTPEQGANTNPQVVKTLVQLALAAGARSVMVFDRPCNPARLTYRRSGIEEAVKSIGASRATCPFMEDRLFVPVKIARGKILHEWTFYVHALRADCYINVPIAKHHGLTRLTLGMKNIMGVIGGNRGQIHQDIGRKLAELNSVVYSGAPRRLTVVDATRILLRNGPTGGNLRDVKVLDTLIASPDIVATDAYATTLFGLEPSAISSTVAGHAMGLGQMDLQKVKIVKV